MFATEAPATEVHHPAWGGHARSASRSTLFRLPASAGAPPLVAVVGLEGDGERTARAALAALRMEVDDLRRARARHLGWLEGLAGLGAALAREPEPAAAVAEALEAVVRHAGAADAALARHADGRLRVAGSRRGVIAAADVLVAAHPGLARALRDGEPAWLEPAAAAALEVPAGLRACAVPVAVAGESLGVLVVVMDSAEELGAQALRPLGVVAAGLGFALLRDRLVGELRRSAAGA
jgi:hypothetical protein